MKNRKQLELSADYAVGLVTEAGLTPEEATESISELLMISVLSAGGDGLKHVQEIEPGVTVKVKVKVTRK